MYAPYHQICIRRHYLDKALVSDLVFFEWHGILEEGRPNVLIVISIGDAETDELRQDVQAIVNVEGIEIALIDSF